VSVLELSDVMDRPRLFSTFMLWLLAQLYHALPEAGDLPKPKLCFFFDEAHLLFDDASEALLAQVEQTVRLIRSKGVGVYFVTQAPTDLPSSVLGQLGNRVQHALRAFTPEDADNLKKTVRTFPMTKLFDVEETITSLGIGEALVTVLSPRGVPTPLAPTRLIPPDSLMAALPPDELRRRIEAGQLYVKYAAAVDPQSAHEIITARLQAAKAAVAGMSGGSPVESGRPTLTPAQERRAIEQRARELERIRREAAQAARAQQREEATLQRAAERERAQRDRLIAQTGSTLLRGVLGTFFGGTRRRR
jgi:hypothetical protein